MCAGQTPSGISAGFAASFAASASVGGLFRVSGIRLAPLERRHRHGDDRATSAGSGGYTPIQKVETLKKHIGYAAVALIVRGRPAATRRKSLLRTMRMSSGSGFARTYSLIAAAASGSRSAIIA